VPSVAVYLRVLILPYLPISLQVNSFLKLFFLCQVKSSPFLTISPSFHSSFVFLTGLFGAIRNLASYPVFPFLFPFIVLFPFCLMALYAFFFRGLLFSGNPSITSPSSPLPLFPFLLYRFGVEKTPGSHFVRPPFFVPLYPGSPPK